MSPPSCRKSALSAESVTEATEAASVARESALRRSCLAVGLSVLGRRFGQSLCQWLPLHHRQGAHLSLHFSFASGRGRFGSAGLPRASFTRSSLLRTANAWAAPGFASSSRRTLRTSASLSTLRAAPIVSARSPTPALSDSLTSSSVERLSLRRRTALATFSDMTESGNCAGTESDLFSL
eukprot:6200335-Pleurochrysis_carterae.AAC.1